MRFRELVVTVVLAVAVVTPTIACVKPGGPVLPSSFGDGNFEAGYDIKVGTYVTANTGPHTDGVRCEWTVAKKSNQGTVLLRSHDTDNKVQRVYVGPDEVITSANCGTWAWESNENTTG